MALATLLIIFLLVVGLIVGIPFAVGAVANSKGGLTQRQKNELRELRNLKDAVETLALENQDVFPEMSYQIRDTIRTHELKELN